MMAELSVRIRRTHAGWHWSQSTKRRLLYYTAYNDIFMFRLLRGKKPILKWTGNAQQRNKHKSNPIGLLKIPEMMECSPLHWHCQTNIQIKIHCAYTNQFD